MKYKPRQSNFEEFSDEVVGRILEAKATIEDVKDAIAREIDEYVEAVINEHVEDMQVFPAQTAPYPVICFSLGEGHTKDGRTDLFYKDEPLKDILESLDFEEFEESSHAISLAETFESLALQCRERATKIETGGDE